MRISDWSSDVCSSDLEEVRCGPGAGPHRAATSDVWAGGGPRCAAIPMSFVVTDRTACASSRPSGALPVRGPIAARTTAGVETRRSGNMMTPFLRLVLVGLGWLSGLAQDRKRVG